MTSRRTALVLFIGDAVCLVGFVLVGMGRHETFDVAHPVLRFAINSLPLIVAWAVAGLSLRVFRFPVPVRLRTVLSRTLAAWLVAAPLGLLARALLLHAATLVVIFVLVALGLGGALLLAWRALFGALFLRRA
jgi:hypothetical protein